MKNRKRSICCGNTTSSQQEWSRGGTTWYILAANLSHDHHQSHGSDVSTLSTHVAACDDLKPRLLSRVHIVGNELGLHDFLLDRMPSLLDSQGIRKLWLSLGRVSTKSLHRETSRQSLTIIIDRYKMCERGNLALLALFAICYWGCRSPYPAMR